MNDIETIKQLKAKYFRALDTKEWDAFRTIFCDDFVSDATGSGGEVIEGADNFVAFVRGALGKATTVHHGYTPEIEITSQTSAKGIWAMEDLVRFLGCIDIHGYGYYHEEYRKAGEQWRISYSKLVRLRMDIRFFFIRFTLPQFLIRKMQKGASR